MLRLPETLTVVSITWELEFISDQKRCNSLISRFLVVHLSWFNPNWQPSTMQLLTHFPSAPMVGWGGQSEKKTKLKFNSNGKVKYNNDTPSNNNFNKEERKRRQNPRETSDACYNFPPPPDGGPASPWALIIPLQVDSPQFIHWTHCFIVWNIHLDSLGHLFWSWSLPAFCAPPCQQSMRHWKVLASG